MGTSNFFRSDYYQLNDIVQGSFLAFPKQLLIENLKERFSSDSYYHYVSDSFGYPKVKNLTGEKVEGGFDDDDYTRIFIGEGFKNDMKFYPSVIVKSGGMKSVPLSFSRNEGVLYHEPIRIDDGYGNITYRSIPSYIALAGAHEGSLTVDITAGSISERDQIAEIISHILTITDFKQLKNAGVVVLATSVGSPSETEDGQDKLHKVTITADIRTEWSKRIYIDSIINTISFCIDFGNLETNPPILAQNLEINSLISFITDL